VSPQLPDVSEGHGAGVDAAAVASGVSERARRGGWRGCSGRPRAGYDV